MKKLAQEIMAGLEDVLAYAQGDKSRASERVVTVSRTDVKAKVSEPKISGKNLSKYAKRLD